MMLSSKFVPAVPAAEVLSKAAADVRREGKNVMFLTDGDPTLYGFHPPKLVQDALKKALDDNYHMYRASSGWEPKLSQAIAEREKKVHAVDYDPDDILITPGSTQALNLAFLTLLDTGDELLAPEPTYQEYFFYTAYMKSKISTVSSIEEEDWRVDIDELRKKVTKKTKGIIINNPNNPTGTVYGEKTLKEITDVAGEYDLPIIADEVYDMVTFDGVKAVSVSKVAGDVPVILTNGPSKSFMTTGWRCGYLAVHDPAEKIKNFTETVKVLGGNVSLVGDVATPVIVAVTTGYQNWHKCMEHLEIIRNHLQKAKDLTVRRLNEISGISTSNAKGTFYAFPKVYGVGKRWKNDTEFMIDLVKHKQVIFVPGSNYGRRTGFGHFRALLLPSLQDLEEIYNRLESFIKEHS
jgi:aspartate/methionine/tyrosine aminotransferase